MTRFKLLLALAALAAPLTLAAQLFPGLDTHHRAVSSKNAEAQRYFEQGLAWVFAFNHDEAIRSFGRAAELDPEFALAWWGVAYANGPHINLPMVDEAHAKAAWEALGKAKGLIEHASPVEQGLIVALEKRYAMPQPSDRAPLDLAYADAMRELFKRFPDDADVGALFAESMMDLSPWNQWTPEGKEAPGTAEIIQTLERVLKLAPRHPLGLHLFIHAVEASPHPERAEAAADRLRRAVPGAGHLVHMPAHIYARIGRWADAESSNVDAEKADDSYRKLSPEQNFYRIYIAHNTHFISYAAMMQGRSAVALAAADRLIAGIPIDFLKANAPFVDPFLTIRLEVFKRFGEWDRILAEPAPADYLPVTTAYWRFNRAVALAAQGKIEAALAEQTLFREASGKVDKGAFWSLNLAADVLSVADQMLAGEISYRKGETDLAVKQLREAVALEDKLHYDEPPGWMTPVRHALGAVLLQSKRYAEAEQVYRDDLARYPANGWSLWGLKRSLELQKKEASVVAKQFDAAWARADIKLSTSCLCVPGI